MEAPGTTYLYTLATLSMTFAGFCAIVIVLRQALGEKLWGFHVVLTKLYLEAGLGATAFCMLPPMLASCGAPSSVVWRTSSGCDRCGHHIIRWHVSEAASVEDIGSVA